VHVLIGLLYVAASGILAFCLWLLCRWDRSELAAFPSRSGARIPANASRHVGCFLLDNPGLRRDRHLGDLVPVPLRRG
jgi:hypothetical protein